MKFWEANTGKLARTLEGHKGAINSLAYSPDGRFLASGSDDKSVVIREAGTDKPVRVLHEAYPIVSAAFDTSGKPLATSSSQPRTLKDSHDSSMKVWDWQMSEGELTFRGHTAGGNRGGVRGLVFSNDGQWLVSGGDDGTVKVWDPRSGKEWQTLRGHQHPITSVAINRDGTRIVSGAATRDPKETELILWDARSGRELQRLEGHQRGVLTVAFSPDGSRIASGTLGTPKSSESEDGSIRIWDANTGRVLHRLGGRKDRIARLAFSPDGRHLASACDDRTIEVWNVIDGKKVTSLTLQHDKKVKCVAFSPNGKWLASNNVNSVQL